MTSEGRTTSHDYLTPPGSFTDCAYAPGSPLTLTPPSTDQKPTLASASVLRIIEDIRTVKRGGPAPSPSPWITYSLKAERYQELQDRLERDECLAGFVKHKLRLDYFSPHKLVIRMPGAVHEVFLAQIVTEIQDQLKAVEGTAAEFAREVQAAASTTLKSDYPEYGRHDPDAQFQHIKALYPGVVIEVSFSQKRRDLPHLADDYILGSDSNIQMVIGIDIEYGGDRSKVATLSVWEPDVILDDEGEKVLVAKQTIDNQVFRDSYGDKTASPTSDLEIPLRNFAPEDLFDDIALPKENITISAEKFKFLQKAENHASMMKEKTGVTKSVARKTWTKKRPREITPAEELCSGDEKRFKADEDKASEKGA